VDALLIAAGEPSKVPLYIVGGLFIVWALGLSTVGLTRPGFPYSERGGRIVMGCSVALMLATMAMAVVTSAFPK
jgi:hypothetical protein